MLPLEIVDDICHRLSRPDLVSVQRVNSVFQRVTTHIVYQHIPSLPLPKSVSCLLTLSTNPTLSSHVRILEIDWRDTSPTANLYHLLHRVLLLLTALTDLSLELPQLHQPFWLLSQPPFNLTSFTTSLPCKQPLAAFLTSQSSITSLCLRAPLQAESSNPFYAYFSHQNVFSLDATILPNLSHFRTIYDRPSVIAAVVQGRPVQMASIPLFASLTTDALQALRKSATPIKRLSVMSFDPFADELLLTAIVNEFPDLEALHVVVLLTEYSNVGHILPLVLPVAHTAFLPQDLLRASGPSLAGFKSLRVRLLFFLRPNTN